MERTDFHFAQLACILANQWGGKVSVKDCYPPVEIYKEEEVDEVDHFRAWAISQMHKAK